MIGYKVFRKKTVAEETLHPVIYPSIYTYSVEFVNVPLPNHGPFAVFDSEFHAKVFMSEFWKSTTHFVIYEVEYEPSDELKLYTPPRGGGKSELNKIDIKYFGTEFAKSVKLIKVVHGTHTVKEKVVEEVKQDEEKLAD